MEFDGRRVENVFGGRSQKGAALREFSTEQIELLRKEVVVLYLRAHKDFRAPEDVEAQSKETNAERTRTGRAAWLRWARVKEEDFA